MMDLVKSEINGISFLISTFNFCLSGKVYGSVREQTYVIAWSSRSRKNLRPRQHEGRGNSIGGKYNAAAHPDFTSMRRHMLSRY